MAQINEAVARYHKILQSDPYKDLLWLPPLRERMEAEALSLGGRLLCPFLRPHFITRRQYDTLVKAGELLISAVNRMQHLVLANPVLLNRLELLPAEKMLASIDPGYKALDVTCRLDLNVSNGSLHLTQYNSDSPTGVTWADGLAEVFYGAPPVKEFRKKHSLSKITGKKYLLSALMSVWRQFHHSRNGRPRIAILEFRPGATPVPSEYTRVRDFFIEEGYAAEVVTPDQLEFKGGILRRGPFVVDLVYRQITVQEFLQRFDLSHPLVQAYRSRAVCLVNSFRSELGHKKAFLGLLTDETLTSKFPAAERKAIREHVPWTRLVNTGKTTYQEDVIDLQQFMLENRERLVLKPNDDHTEGSLFYGVDMDRSAWERAIKQAMRMPYVVQERVGPAKAVFPLERFGPLEFQELRVDLHLQAYLGRVHSCVSWLSSGSPGGFSATSGMTPTFILEGAK
ncbi:MAG: hypothetical protein ACKV22_22730 [Bryobacteraceae bacterium]